MKNTRSFLIALLLGLGVGSNVFAANVSIQGTIPGVVALNQAFSHANFTNNDAIGKEIVFQRVVLSPEAQKLLSKRVDALTKSTRLNTTLANLPANISLGMNGTPVLDQGRHGTCVTFAATGAIDAAVGEKTLTTSDDYYSQLCNLELGSTLESQSPVDVNGAHTYPSGWDGSWGEIVLGQIKKYGLITKQYQTTKGCAGVREYPLMVENDHGRPMTIADFENNSKKAASLVTYKIIMSPEEGINADTTKVLQRVKSALTNGHRVIFGTLLDVDQGYNGALGSYKTKHDTWVLTSDIAENVKNNRIEAGHEMIIIGYDDNAMVIGPNDEKHQGVLTLRNSWGKYAGDQGNYYMTYDHFQVLALEAAEIIPVK